MSEVRRILDQMDRAFAGNAWHGPPLMYLLDGISAEGAAKHPIPNVHSIWEIVNHVAAWNMIVRRRAVGETVDVAPELDWPPIEETTDEDWHRAVEQLKESRARLRTVVESISDDKLFEKVLGQRYPLYGMLHGLIQHDLYHAGQIAILKKAIVAETNSADASAGAAAE